MKRHTLALITFALLASGCATIDPEQYAATQRQVNDLSTRLKKLEADQVALQTRLDEVGKGARLPSGAMPSVTPRGAKPHPLHKTAPAAATKKALPNTAPAT